MFSAVNATDAQGLFSNCGHITMGNLYDESRRIASPYIPPSFKRQPTTTPRSRNRGRLGYLLGKSARFRGATHGSLECSQGRRLVHAGAQQKVVRC